MSKPTLKQQNFHAVTKNPDRKKVAQLFGNPFSKDLYAFALLGEDQSDSIKITVKDAGRLVKALSRFIEASR